MKKKKEGIGKILSDIVKLEEEPMRGSDIKQVAARTVEEAKELKGLLTSDWYVSGVGKAGKKKK